MFVRTRGRRGYATAVTAAAAAAGALGAAVQLANAATTTIAVSNQPAPEGNGVLDLFGAPLTRAAPR